MTTPRSLLDAYAAHVADENRRADEALEQARDTEDPIARRRLLDARHDALNRAHVWQAAHGMAVPHFPAQWAGEHVPGRVRLGNPGDGEPGEGDE